MLLAYNFKNYDCEIFIQWTADTGESAVFQDIVTKVCDMYGLNPNCFYNAAMRLDVLTDKLYEQIYIFNDEYSGVPYNPKLRRILSNAFSELSSEMLAFQLSEKSAGGNLIADLFGNVLDKLREMVEIYLDDNAYQCKYRERLRNKEQYIETTHEGHLSSFEFEDILLQMTYLSRLLACLTQAQRSRLVKHIFLNYTFQEIADHENVTKQSVQESIAAALKKIKQRLT